MASNMDVIKANILETFFEEYQKGKEGNWEKVNHERAGVNKREFIEACKELKKEGYLPEFSIAGEKTGDIEKMILFFGEPGDKAKKIFKEMENEE